MFVIFKHFLSFSIAEKRLFNRFWETGNFCQKLSLKTESTFWNSPKNVWFSDIADWPKNYKNYSQILNLITNLSFLLIWYPASFAIMFLSDTKAHKFWIEITFLGSFVALSRYCILHGNLDEPERSNKALNVDFPRPDNSVFYWTKDWIKNIKLPLNSFLISNAFSSKFLTIYCAFLWNPDWPELSKIVVGFPLIFRPDFGTQQIGRTKFELLRACYFLPYNFL